MPDAKTNDIIEAYYRTNYDKLIKATSYRVGSIPNAEDVVQEAFTRAIKYKDSFHQDQSFDNWFTQILKNCIRDYQQELRLNGMTTEFEEDHEEVVEDQEDNKSLLARMGHEINKYPTPKRDILELIFLKGFKPREIPKTFNISATNVWKIVSRFRAKMMDRYGELVP